jgi:POT family proton-dependent oligopeptide transporter
MGINIGAFAGPLICGYLGQRVDWHLGFSAAGFGMLLGIIQYRYGLKYLGDAGTLADTSPEAQAARKADWGKLYAAIGAVLGVALLLFLLRGTLGLTLQGLAQATGMTMVILAILYFAYVIGLGGLTSREQKRVFVIFLLFVGAALFWSGFEQAGSSMNLFAERYTDWNFFGWEMPASWAQSINPLFIIMMAPVFAALWVWLGQREPSIPMKFGVGLGLLGLGFVVLSQGSKLIPADTANFGGLSPMWLLVTYFLHTCGELCLSPVGLSSVTKLSPQRYVGQMMGTWFLGAALGNLIAGLVAGRIESKPIDELFLTVALIVIGGGVLFMLFTIPIQKMIGNLNSDD